MTATRPRHLAAVPDRTQSVATHTRVIESVEPAGRETALAREHDNACLAALAPDVTEQQQAAIAKAMRAAGRQNADLRAILLDLTRAMFVTGYMNGAADQKQAGHLELTDMVLAEVITLETRERAELPAKERALRAVRP